MSLSSPGIKLSTLNGHLICGLCGGYLIDATVLTECVHVFCRSCILKYLMNHKVCPLCQSLIHETRPGHALRPDVALQRVVYKLVPGLLRLEMKRLMEFKSYLSKYLHSSDGQVLKGDKEDQSLFSNANCNADFASLDLRPPQLPTPLATRSLSRSPSGLLPPSLTKSSKSIPPNTSLPQSAAFLIDDDENVSLALSHRSDLSDPMCHSEHPYLSLSVQPAHPSMRSPVQDPIQPKVGDAHDDKACLISSVLTPAPNALPTKRAKHAETIYLLCPSCVTIATLHSLLLAKYQLDARSQVVDIYLDGECLEPSHSLREIAFLYAFPTRLRQMCLQFAFSASSLTWWGRPMPRLERPLKSLDPTRDTSPADHDISALTGHHPNRHSCSAALVWAKQASSTSHHEPPSFQSTRNSQGFSNKMKRASF